MQCHDCKDHTISMPNETFLEDKREEVNKDIIHLNLLSCWGFLYIHTHTHAHIYVYTHKLICIWFLFLDAFTVFDDPVSL